ncbi:glycosyltransferase [Xanthomonas melonis]|uniref:Glycosyltransferase n=1 Tax=Xanthomonas melonis TaxID=56456 RepID=A0ABS8P0J4_9XANT|nr:glycosyltransferase [Xanthomonas melonis]MCC4586108.1 glycosyltransferase family 4 protein [Xanthomonas sp. NCPPB 1067]MCD0246718.1 glycosyltransferase [Xanthomonas melonis]MCD0260428.1 glycosyltransferase [Xanthomonas melonis]MCD0268662.1 glycosyltransferase [Xanthomonas melonis]
MNSKLAALLDWKARRLLRTLRGGVRSLVHGGVLKTLAQIKARSEVTGAKSYRPVHASASTQNLSSDILILDAMMPDPRRDSGSVRMLGMLMLIRSLGRRVAFFPNSGHATLDEVEQLHKLGVTLVGIAGAHPLPQWMKVHGARLNAVVVSRPDVARANWSLIRAFAPQAVLVFDTVDLHFVRLEREARLSGDRFLLRKAHASRRQELRFARAADHTLVVSAAELQILHSAVPDASIHVLSNIHEIQGCEATHAQRSGLLFVGGFGHSPNRDAVLWLLKSIMPEVRRHLPDSVLHLVGDMPKDQLPRDELEGVKVHGRIDDLREVMESSLAALAPLRAGAGVKGKVNSAMSYGLPVIATSIAAEGMHLTDGHDVLLANTPEQFAVAVAKLQTDANLWQRLSANGLRNIETHFGRNAALAVLEQVLSGRQPESQ